MTPETINFQVDRERPRPVTISDVQATGLPVGMRDQIRDFGDGDIGRPFSGVDLNIATAPVSSISGTAKDASTFPNGETLAMSGIRAVDLQFFDSLGNEDGTLRVVVEGCTAGLCVNHRESEAGHEWTTDLTVPGPNGEPTPFLSPGVWTVKVYAIDWAGNRSNASRGITFLYV